MFLTVILALTLKSGFALRAVYSSGLHVRAAPLERGKAKFTVKTPYAANRRLGHTAFLTVIFTLALTSGAAVTMVVMDGRCVHLCERVQDLSCRGGHAPRGSCETGHPRDQPAHSSAAARRAARTPSPHGTRLRRSSADTECELVRSLPNADWHRRRAQPHALGR